MNGASILKFELRYWLKNSAVYLYAAIFAGLAFFSMAGAAGAFGAGSSGVRVANAPGSILEFTLFFNKMLLLLLPTIVGASVCRDYQCNIHSILYAYPISKRDYILGKFCSAFLIVILIAMMAPIGLMLGEKFPGNNPAQLAAFDVSIYLYVVFIYLIPNLLLVGILVFVVVTRTRNIYTGFVLVVILMILREILARLAGGPAGMLFEPFGEVATNALSKNWTPTERDTFAIPFNSMVLYNRLFWLGVAAAIFGVFYRQFSFNQDVTTRQRNRSRRLRTAPEPRFKLPVVTVRHHFFHQIKTVFTLSFTDFKYITQSGAFLSLMLVGSIFIGVLMLQMNPQTDIKLLPLTWVMLGFPVFFFSYLIQVLTFLYAGMLIHRAKIARMDDLIHATQTPNWVFYTSKLLALAWMQITLLSLIMVAGVAVQSYHGFGQIEIGHYLFDLYAIHLIGFLIWAAAALFVQSVLTNPYLGMFLLVIGALGISLLPSLGVHSPIFRFNEGPETAFFLKYSDLSGHTHAMTAYFGYKFYWAVFGILLGCLSLLYWQRERTQSFAARVALAKSRFSGSLAYTSIVALTLFTGVGAYFYKIERAESNNQPGIRAEKALLLQFKHKYKDYTQMPQPRIVALTVNMQIYPESRSFVADGRYVLVNKTSEPITTLLVRSGYDEITDIRFAQPARKISEDTIFKFAVWELETALAPKDSMNLLFTVRNKPNTLLNRNSNVLCNGTYLKSGLFPRLGNFTNSEKALPDSMPVWPNHYQSADSDLIDFEAIVSTSSDQTAIAPGYLQKTWMENGRRYFHYKMDRPIKFVFGFNSGKFDLFQEQYKGVDLRIYHHPTHTYNRSQLMAGLKASLDYNTAYFGSFQHRQIQIIEFSRTEGSYATTAANCIPTSETRFVNDAGNADSENTDISFYVAAHELSHQWWGNQVIPADALGALMITESITEYITAKIYEKKFGKKQALKFLKIQSDRYLQGRTTESQTEPPLIHVHPDQSYIAYGKGALSFYALSEHIGEEALNKALRDYLEKAKQQQGTYTTSLELVEYLRKATPEKLQFLITDLFESADADKLLKYF